MNDDQSALLAAHIDDMLASDRFGRTAFLDPRERRFAERHLKDAMSAGRTLFYGGCSGCERVRLFVFPEYIADTAKLLSGGDKSCEDALIGLEADELADGAAPVLIKGSGYRELSHRDYLGALLSLGIERGVLGDIVAPDLFSAVLFCDGRIAPFICENLTKVASDTVKAGAYILPAGFSAERKTERRRDTVASMRADCVIGAIANLSRDDAKKLVLSSAADVNFEPLTKPDRELCEGDVISLRGYGRFRIAAQDGKSRSGRVRLEYEKFI